MYKLIAISPLLLLACTKQDGLDPCLLVPVRIEVQYDAAQYYPRTAKERAAAVWSEVQKMYWRDLGICLQLDTLIVWNRPDPYGTGSAGGRVGTAQKIHDRRTMLVVMGLQWGGMAYQRWRTGPAYTMLADTTTAANAWCMAHEIGHLLGAVHADGPGIMSQLQSGLKVPGGFSSQEGEVIKAFTLSSCGTTTRQN